jgi:hypothetical protein
MPQRRLHYAGPEASQMLGYVRHPAFGQDGERPCHLDLRPLREVLEILSGGFDPAYGACVSQHPKGMLSYLATKVNEVVRNRLTTHPLPISVTGFNELRNS